MDDPFGSGWIALTLAWLAVVGSLLYALGSLVAFLFEKKDMARPFKLWLVLCLAFLAPTRYVFFQFVLGESYMVQSWFGFFSSFLLGLYVPIVFGILYLIAFGLPLGVTLLVLGDEDRRDAGRYIGAVVVLPIICLVSTWLFHLALPYAAKTVRWLPAEPVIKATNGPAAVVFDYIAAPLSPLTMPKYFELTPQDAIALRRCHVAALYLSSNQEARFVKKAYPLVYNEISQP